jgi:uncharacterized membrane protein YkvA (DUF1232 family)
MAGAPLERLKAWARRLKADAMTLWFARRHPDTPWWVKALVLIVVAYALSPIDLIPDAVPVLGLLDDAVLLPVLIWLALRGVPPHVREDARHQAARWMAEGGQRPRSLVGAAVIVALWLLLLAGAALWAWRALGGWF